MAKAGKNQYEVTALLSPELSEAEADSELARLQELVDKMGGFVLGKTRWKKRKLAYPIKDFEEGFYGVLQFSADKAILPELDYQLRYNPNCLRYLILNITDRKGVSIIKKGGEKPEGEEVNK